MRVEVGRVRTDARRVIDEMDTVRVELDSEGSLRVVDEDMARWCEAHAGVVTPDAQALHGLLDLVERGAGAQQVGDDVELGDVVAIAYEVRVGAKATRHVQEVSGEAGIVHAVG